MDNVLAKPVDLCCLEGSFHSGEPTGSTIQIDGIDTYVAKPHPDKSNGNALLFFPDASGLHINSFLMMDAFAECGYLTLGVDYFLGDPVTNHSLAPLSDPNFDFESWKNKHLKASEDAAARWVKAVKAQYGSSEDVKFACVGYCWGARFVRKQLSADGICKVGAIAHPSFLKESDVFYVQAPIFFSVPSTDKLFEPEQRSRTIEILTENNKQFNMQVFANVGHGFASRARLTDLYEKWAKEASFRSFVDWFDFRMEKK
ncbi:dienelactone hydrolase [Fusarium pseudocircinatum]|uniref:Dienelactone hydrolase n=1 Tax=Fusarium pseudocircinatum TaxID=56676 RepID=A0A8H5NWG5_9HYPO|nr:dienelactone hydrolase [Fusarium pseudocircinatum]